LFRPNSKYNICRCNLVVVETDAPEV